MTLLTRIKLKKLQKLENYLAYVENMDETTFVPLSVGSEEALSETTKDKLFVYLPMHKELDEKYNLQSVAGDGDDFEKTVAVMQWLTNKTYYSGASIKWNADNSIDILDYAYEKDFKNAICCREKAIVLSDCLLAVGVYAYPLCMLAAENKGCHFCVQVYLREQGKWAIFDPSFDSWFTRNGVLLNAVELRQMFLDGEEPTLAHYSFNGTDRCKDIYVKGFVRQLLTNLSTWSDNTMDRRGYKRNDWNSKKEFKTKIPNFEMI